jgi:ankyrin repeat protein
MKMVLIVLIIGKTILCNLAELHQPNTTSLEPFWVLLEFFADPNIKDKTGNTALHYAVRNKNKALILCLMLFGASNEITNEEGKKPFEVTNMGEEAAYINEKINNFKFSFLQLTRKRRNRLRRIFQFIDTDQGGYIAELNMIQFNMWLNDDNETDARDDAKKFLEEASVFKSGTVFN